MKRILLVVSILFSMSLFAQTKGIVVGKVTDNQGLSLPGANVIIKKLSIGNTTDFSGDYTIVNIPAGKHVIEVSYLGYKTIKKEVAIENKSAIRLNFTMEAETNSLNEIVIVGAMAQGQARALNQQKTNTNITNVVAADQVGKFPDANIGDALKRIPGISMQNDQGEARDIIVRGLAPQLNSVTLNGDRIPSAEGDNRRVQMDLIPSDMVQAVEVNKAVTPDMEADAIGGSVNLVTRTAPSKFKASITAGYGRNPIRNKPLYNLSTTIANRFAGDKVGVVLSASHQSNEYGSDNVEFEWDGDDQKPYVSDYQVRKYNVKRVRQSVAANFDFKLAENQTLFIKSMYNQRNDWENRFRFRYKGIKEVSPGVYKGEARRQTKGGTEDNARLEKQKVYKVSLSGKHVLLNSVKLNWKTGFSKASEKRPNERYISFKNKGVKLNQDITDTRFPNVVPVDASSNAPSEFKLKEISEENKSTAEKNFNAKIDAKIPLIGKGDYKSSLKLGYKLKNKSKDRDNIFYEYEPTSGIEKMTDVTYSDQTVKDFMPGSKYKLGNFATASYLGKLALADKSKFDGKMVLEEFVPTNYEAKEMVNSAYAMLEQKLGSKLTMIAGLRLENTNINYTGYSIDVETAESLDDVKKISKSTNYQNWLPNLQFKYDLAKNTILRFAFTNTIARPNYYDLVPYQNINSDDLEFSEGNPELEATKSINLDAMFEHYFSSVGLISGGVFYKNVSNWIYDFRDDSYTNSAFPNLVFEYKQARNGKEAQLYGFELALQRRLDFLPSFLRNLNLYLNYTYTDSNTDGIEGRNDVPLAGAVKNMFNGSLSYETSKLSVRTSLNFADSYIDEYGKKAFEDRYYDQQLFLDANASYEVYKGLRLFAEFKNLTNQELRYFQGQKDRTMQSEHYGINWNVGVKYNF